MSSVRVAACQISSGPEPSGNLRLIADAVARAADGGAQLAVLPEASMVCFGSDLAAVAQPVDGPFADALRALADRHRLTLVAGLFTPADPGRVHNTLLLTGPDGEATYRKVHLYDAFGARESDTVAPGDTYVTAPVAGMTVGLATCYDLRFAEQFTSLGRSGADLVVVPASWGEGPGKSQQWDLLVRARAADAQAWLLAVDQAWSPPAGVDPLGVGRSALIDPIGQVRAALGSSPDVLIADIDLDLVESTRARIPIL